MLVEPLANGNPCLSFRLEEGQCYLVEQALESDLGDLGSVPDSATSLLGGF